MATTKSGKRTGAGTYHSSTWGGGRGDGTGYGDTKGNGRGDGSWFKGETSPEMAILVAPQPLPTRK
jgi:hypothetical protein